MIKFYTLAILLFAFCSHVISEPVRITIDKKQLAETIIVDDLFPWLIPIMTPVVAIHKDKPILIATDEKEKPEHLVTVTKTQNCFYVGNTIADLNYPDVNIKTCEVTSPLETSINIARKFWKKTNHAIVVSMSSPQIVMQSSVFAAIYKIPILLLEEEVNNEKEGVIYKAVIENFVEDFEIKKIIMLGNMPLWMKDICEYDVYHLRKVQQAIIEKFKPENITNVIVSRSPTNSYFPRSEWIIPYLSFMRRAPIFFSHTPKADKLETIFDAYISQYSLSPRNITIVADEHNIQLKLLKIPSSEEIFEVLVEPFTDPQSDEALNYGLGRIPFSTLEESSLMVARGFAHEKIMTQNIPRVLLASNPTAELGLAETISRITVDEFKNFDVEVAAFYSENYDDDKIWESLTNANLVIYEGHVVDQRVYVDPETEFEEDLFFFDDGDNSQESVDPQESNSEDQAYSFIDPFKGPGVVQKSDGLPIVMLQSCNSLEMETAQYIFKCGSPAIIGTTTNVHSGSGSSILKVICDEILYNNATIGEALLHGRNYFFCLNKLKALRGHNQMAKSKRVALSFKLWGDPELKIFPELKKKNKIVEAKLDVSEQRIVITTPKNKMPECITDNYYSDMFYYSKTAGIVKKIKNKVQRKLAPFYFFKIALPDNWTKNNFDLLYQINKDENGIRTIFKTSQNQKFVYVLHFPEKVEKKVKIELQFAKSE